VAAHRSADPPVAPVRIGVDIGGTFTDLIFRDEATGVVRLAKTPTTPEALEKGVLRAVEAAAAPELLERTDFFLHGTTVGLNAMLMRSGARTGLICTDGFRDIIEIGRGDRSAMYDIKWRRPLPLVPRRHRTTVRERIRADGEILTPLQGEDVAAVLRTWSGEGIESIAVCLINAYVNPVHELEVEELLREHGYAGEISLSHRLSREYREFERASTTVVDAYIRPVTSRYIEGLLGGLTEAGFKGEMMITRSGGGVMGAPEFAERPFEAIQSGPVAGAEAAAELSRAYGWALTITADVGGTSFDTALILDGRPQVNHEGMILGWPLQTAWVEVASIGAGGGSIAYADAGLLRVGPRSAGAAPGPACYGHGGTEPTVTDAALLLGMLGDGALSNDLRLDREQAHAAVERLATELGMSVEQAAQGTLRIATTAMAEAIREITIGQGEDPRRARLVAFGGAGPLFATLLAGELGVAEIIIPPYAGNFSAWGLLGQDVTRSNAQTMFRAFNEQLAPELTAAVAQMFDELLERVPQWSSEEVEQEVGLDLRYVGQEHTITIRVPVESVGFGPAEMASIEAAFHVEYERRFGIRLLEPTEVVTVRATARRRLPNRSKPVLSDERTGVARAATVKGYSFVRERWLDFAVLERADLRPASTVDGPAIIFEPTTTIYVDDEFVIGVDDSATLSLTPKLGEEAIR
jgi:N-methylhydantoinase A